MLLTSSALACVPSTSQHCLSTSNKNMASPPTSPESSAPQSPLTEPGPSNVSGSPSNKRPASTSLSDSETLVTRNTKTPASCGRKSRRAVVDAYKRRRKKKKLPITQIRPQITRVSVVRKPTSPKVCLRSYLTTISLTSVERERSAKLRKVYKMKK